MAFLALTKALSNANTEDLSYRLDSGVVGEEEEEAVCICSCIVHIEAVHRLLLMITQLLLHCPVLAEPSVGLGGVPSMLTLADWHQGG